MKLIFLILFAASLAACASKPNYQLDCEKKADGAPSLYQCKEYPWYMGNQCSRVK